MLWHCLLFYSSYNILQPEDLVSRFEGTLLEFFITTALRKSVDLITTICRFLASINDSTLNKLGPSIQVLTMQETLERPVYLWSINKLDPPYSRKSCNLCTVEADCMSNTCYLMSPLSVLGRVSLIKYFSPIFHCKKITFYKWTFNRAI